MRGRKKVLKYQMKCPKCHKRAFDISAVPEIPILIELKCPNCKKIVSISFTKNMSDVPSNGA
ncbi:MAG: hypothetical protein K2J08_06380 [Ruminococcus sp.]|nr:hypothetical protein [Ruminococcus sp.]